MSRHIRYDVLASKSTSSLVDEKAPVTKDNKITQITPSLVRNNIVVQYSRYKKCKQQVNNIQRKIDALEGNNYSNYQKLNKELEVAKERLRIQAIILKQLESVKFIYLFRIIIDAIQNKKQDDRIALLYEMLINPQIVVKSILGNDAKHLELLNCVVNKEPFFKNWWKIYAPIFQDKFLENVIHVKKDLERHFSGVKKILAAEIALGRENVTPQWHDGVSPLDYQVALEQFVSVLNKSLVGYQELYLYYQSNLKHILQTLVCFEILISPNSEFVNKALLIQQKVDFQEMSRNFMELDKAKNCIQSCENRIAAVKERILKIAELLPIPWEPLTATISSPASPFIDFKHASPRTCRVLVSKNPNGMFKDFRRSSAQSLAVLRDLDMKFK